MTDKKIPAVLVRTPYGKKKGVEIYYRFVQRAAAASGNPHLKAMLSSVCAGSAFGDLPRRGGCFTSGILAWAFAMAEQKIDRDKMVRGDWDAVLDMRPLEEIPQKADKPISSSLCISEIYLALVYCEVVFSCHFKSWIEVCKSCSSKNCFN